MRSIEPGISRFRVWCWRTIRNDGHQETRARGPGRREAARAWTEEAGENLLLSSASEGERPTAGDHEQHQGDTEQDADSDHLDIGVGRGVRTRDGGGVARGVWRGR